MEHEVFDLLCTEMVTITLRSSVPSGFTVLPAIWIFHCKHAPNWSILKHKARLYPHGGKQVAGEHF